MSTETLAPTQRDALDSLAWNGHVRAGRGYNLRTLRSLEQRGYCYITWSEGDWKAMLKDAPERGR